MSKSILNFIIPVRHYLSVKDWGSVKENISNTLATIDGQKSECWHCYIVANEGTDLPDVGDKFTIINVDFPLNHLPDQFTNKELFYNKVREDKGARIYEAIKYCRSDDYFMVVDYDDYINESLAEYVSMNPQCTGWYVSTGYFYSGGNFILKHNNFDEFCGTSNIVKVSFIEQFHDSNGELPFEKIKELLGSHKFIKKYMRKMNFDYQALPFAGAIYNIGIPTSTSQTPSIIKRVFSPRAILKKPYVFVCNLFNLRTVTLNLQNSFNFKKK